MSFLSRLGSLLGSSPIDEQLYDCDCGAPMENTGAYTKGQGETRYRVENWECTDGDCWHTAQAYIFVDPTESYGKGCLSGQVKGREL